MCIRDSLRNGEPMDQNVYEGAFWSSVSELSEYSVAQGIHDRPGNAVGELIGMRGIYFFKHIFILSLL